MANRMKFAPIALFSSMRAEDSLITHTSYFFAELKRLSKLMEMAKAGEPVFVFLDEILRGTNSVDKAKGTRAFIEKLIEFNVMGILATHDLSLCELAERYPDKIKNYRFEVLFDEDEMKFDYKLLPGVCQTMNASILMQKMGIVDNI